MHSFLMLKIQHAGILCIFKAGNHPIVGHYCKCIQIVYSDENILIFGGQFKQSNICLASNRRK